MSTDPDDYEYGDQPEIIPLYPSNPSHWTYEDEE